MAPNVSILTADCPPILYHVGRVNDPLRFSVIDPLDAELSDVGNRFDVVGSGVIYASTEKVGAYKETVASLRPAASSFAYENGQHEHFMNLGAVPAEWREARRLVSFGLREPLPFVDLEQDETLSVLTRELAPQLVDLGIANLDSAAVRGSNRLLTRAIASWAYVAVDENDEARYSGIRFSSRFQSHECWALFEGVVIDNVTTSSIAATDTALSAAARDFGLTVH